MEKYIERLKKSIQDKNPPLKVAETRLSKRTKRPEVEACSDQPHETLTTEVKELKDSVGQLDVKLSEAQEALTEMGEVKSKLEADIKVKHTSLNIDKQKCMGVRRRFPYNIVSTRYF